MAGWIGFKMNTMRAVIYAAGRANRLGPAYRDRPKVMLEFGGASLLERHVRCLAAVGCGGISVVSGYCREFIRDALPGLERAHGIPMEEIYNSEYSEGSALSFASSLPRLRDAGGPVLVMDGDVLYDVRILDRLVRSKHRTVLVVDTAYSTADDDPVLVPIRAGAPFDFRKQWTGEAELVGESIGFFKIDPEDLPLLIGETEKRLTGPGRMDSYDDILRVMVRAGRFGYEDVTGIPWTEIDFPQDVEYAERQILPRIAAGAARI